MIRGKMNAKDPESNEFRLERMRRELNGGRDPLEERRMKFKQNLRMSDELTLIWRDLLALALGRVLREGALVVRRAR